jgi:uncharacterized alkaline shock family protein YloU
MVKVSQSENLPVPFGENRIELHTYAPRPADKITIAPSVLLTVVRMGVLQVPGVAHMGNTPGGVNAWLRRTPAERGVQVMIDDQMVTIDLYIVANADSNLRDVSRQVQQQVARVVQENVGMTVGTINIHIEDVVFESLSQSE